MRSAATALRAAVRHRQGGGGRSRTAVRRGRGPGPGRAARDTPGRVARAFAEQFSGLHTDPSTVLDTSFDENHNEMILMRDIDAVLDL